LWLCGEVSLDSLKQAIKDKAKEGSFKVKRPYAKRYKRVAGDWIRLSDVLNAVGDLEKSHIIKSRKEIQEMKEWMYDNSVEGKGMFAIPLEKLLGDEK